MNYQKGNREVMCYGTNRQHLAGVTTANHALGNDNACRCHV